MAARRFDKRATFLLATIEVEMLQQLADRDGLSASDVVRQLIRRQHAAVFGEQPVKPNKARKRKT